MGIETHIYCDKCGKGIVYSRTMAKNTAIMLMRNKGWSVGKRWLCPDCRKKNKA